MLWELLVTCDTWHVTPDTWHMTHDIWHILGVNILSKCQLPSFYGLWVMMHRRFRGKGSLNYWVTNFIFIRPGVAGAVLQTHSSFINSLSPWVFSSQSSRYHKSQTIRVRKLKFWENVHPLQHVTCHVSHVTCCMSDFMWHMSCVTCHIFFDNVVKLIGGGSVINGAYPV